MKLVVLVGDDLTLFGYINKNAPCRGTIPAINGYSKN